MKFTASLAAELAALSAALDEPESDIGLGLRQLAAAAAAVPSYMGLSVVVDQHDPAFTVTLLEEGGSAGDIGASILLTWTSRANGDDAAGVAFILYARTPGAFVDLAADVSWLTGSLPTEFVLDTHLGLPAEPDTATAIAATSLINQAIGVLIGRGYTPNQADRELDANSTRTEAERVTAAEVILARLSPDGDLDLCDIQ